MATVTTTIKYRSAKMNPSTKARYVNKWQALHEAFPDVAMDDWCAVQNISTGTFYAWLKDPKLNKRLRMKMKAEKAAQNAKLAEEKKQEVKEAPTENDEPGLFDEIDEILDRNDERFQNFEEQQEAPEISVETHVEESPKEEEKEVEVKPSDRFLIFTCPDFRLEVSSVLPATEVNRIIGYLRGTLRHYSPIKQVTA